MSRLVLLNYADRSFRSAQRLNSRSGKQVGGFHRVLSYGPRDIDSTFYQQHENILSQARGAGYWLWKPYFILRALRGLEPGDWLFYCDSGSYFTGSMVPVVDLAKKLNARVVTFEIDHPERKYTKRDVFTALRGDETAITDTPQRCGGFQLYQVSEAALDFAASVLRYCTREELVTDASNRLGKENYPDFIDHRHDQSILSVLSKQWGLPALRDPSQFGNPFTERYAACTYPQLIQLTRQRDLSRWQSAKRRLTRSIFGRGRGSDS